MTDSNHIANQGIAHSHQSIQIGHGAATHQHHPDDPGYEGTDPDLVDRRGGKRSLVSSVQIGASAAAAVTSALAASFFGVAGTLIGAAVGSIISTIAGALYTEYLGRAGKKILVTKEVVIQRIPTEALATTPLRQTTSPIDLPGEQSLRPIGAEPGDETVDVPLAETTGLVPNAYPDGTGQARRRWVKPTLIVLGVSVAGFAIALAVILLTESAIGHPVSGGQGNSISKSIDSTRHSGTKDSSGGKTPTPTATPSPSVTRSTAVTPRVTVTATVSTVPSATGAPTRSATSAPTATPEPSVTEPAAAPTDATTGAEPAAQPTSAP